MTHRSHTEPERRGIPLGDGIELIVERRYGSLSYWTVSVDGHAAGTVARSQAGFIPWLHDGRDDKRLEGLYDLPSRAARKVAHEYRRRSRQTGAGAEAEG